jgi:GntR family transcriptional regulator
MRSRDGHKAREHRTVGPGQGTFVVGTLPGTDRTVQAQFLAEMTRWLRSARLAGLGPEDIEAIYHTAFRNCFAEGVA